MSPKSVQRKGCFIVLEGIDGAGTTTQLALIKKSLEERGYEVHLTKEPSDNPIGVLLRQVLKGSLSHNGHPMDMDDDTVALLFAADRLNHLSAEIKPALEAGQVVISDRYYGSSQVYQGPLCGSDWVKEINSRAKDPDLVLFFNLPVATASSRRQKRGEPVERFEQDDFLAQVQERYQALYKDDPKVVEIDATMSVPDVTAACLKSIYAVLNQE